MPTLAPGFKAQTLCVPLVKLVSSEYPKPLPNKQVPSEGLMTTSSNLSGTQDTVPFATQEKDEQKKTSRLRYYKPIVYKIYMNHDSSRFCLLKFITVYTDEGPRRDENFVNKNLVGPTNGVLETRSSSSFDYC